MRTQDIGYLRTRAQAEAQVPMLLHLSCSCRLCIYHAGMSVAALNAWRSSSRCIHA